MKKIRSRTSAGSAQFSGPCHIKGLISEFLNESKNALAIGYRKYLTNNDCAGARKGGLV